MPTVKFNQESMPQTEEEFRQILQDTLKNRSMLDDFIQIIRDLKQLELKHNLESDLFFSRFQQGEMGDEIEFVRWANKYEAYQETKIELEYLFDLLAQYALPVTA